MWNNKESSHLNEHSVQCVVVTENPECSGILKPKHFFLTKKTKNESWTKIITSNGALIVFLSHFFSFYLHQMAPTFFCNNFSVEKETDFTPICKPERNLQSNHVSTM